MTSTDHTRRALVVGAAIVDDLSHPTVLLAARRTEPSRLAGGWELPGGKVEDGESAQQALHRELLEELGVRVHLGDPLPGPLVDPAQVAFTGGAAEPGAWPLGDRYAMQVWFAAVIEGAPEPLEDHDMLRWLTRQGVPSVAWLTDDLPVVDAARSKLSGRN